MAVQCPASGCDYAGTLDAVEGHIGGVADTLHEGAVTADLAESLHGKASEGVSKGLLAVGIIGLIVLMWWVSRSRTSENGPAEGSQAEGERYA